jgi:rubredoxin
MKSNHIIKINALGGIFTPLKLKKIVQIAHKHQAKHINFGSRQEIYFNIHNDYLFEFDEEMQLAAIDFEIDAEKNPNIVSSYPAEGIFSVDYWLSEGIYKDIFDLFDFQPKLKINISDKNQSLIPFFSGELNFISSETYQYWYLYLNLSNKSGIVRWNKLIYTTDIPKICREIEELILNNEYSDTDEIMRLVDENTKYLFIPITKDLEIPRFLFPYYEGLVRYGNNLWLGIYRRDYLFPIPFVYEFCELCLQTNIAQFCITPWRTLLVKGIEIQDRMSWEKLLGKHGINLRHSTMELNWMVEDINSDEVSLKKYIINELNDKDARTFGLVFGIKLNSANYFPASVIIEKRSLAGGSDFNLLNKFDIYHSENFNPNNPKKILFAKTVSKHNLVSKILELCNVYYNSLNEIETPIKLKANPNNKNVIPQKVRLFQCKDCLSIYDERLGEEISGIPAHTLFSSLSATYICPTCEAPHSNFIEIDEEMLVLR